MLRVCTYGVDAVRVKLLSVAAFHPARTANQKLQAAIQRWLNNHGRCFSSLRVNIFSPLPILFLPDSPIYWPQQLRDYGGIQMRRSTQRVLLGPEPRKKESLSSSRRGIAFVLLLHVTSALAG